MTLVINNLKQEMQTTRSMSNMSQESEVIQLKEELRIMKLQK